MQHANVVRHRAYGRNWYGPEATARGAKSFIATTQILETNRAGQSGTARFSVDPRLPIPDTGPDVLTV